MEARKTGRSLLTVLCMALFLLTAFAAGAWAGDSASFVSKTYPDNSTIAGGTSFTQRWTIRNSGTTTWTSSYKLRWMSGNLSSSHTDIPVSGAVAPGANYTFSIAMRTPAAQTSAATYKEEWKFINGSGATLAPLGSLWAQIVVPAASDDHGNSISTATAVNVNSNRSGVINSAGDYDYFRIVVPSSGTLTVYTTGSTDTYGYLKNSSGSDLASNDDYSGTNFRISQSVTAGTYYVAVRHYSSGTGSYTFYNSFTAAQTDDHGNSISTATAVSVNTSKAGVINSAGDYDYFRVSVPSNGTLTVYTTGSTDTYGYLKNSSGSDLSSNDDQLNGDTNFRISANVTAGTYYVAVRHYSSTGTGTYTLLTTFTATISNGFVLYPLVSNLSIAESSVTLSNPFGAQAFGGTHTGVDIMKPSGTAVYSVGNGIVQINNTNRNYGNVYSNYWNSFLIVYYPSISRYVYYGHLVSSLAVGSSVSKYQLLGYLRPSYNSSYTRTPGNDHLHFGIKTNLITSGWGYAAAGMSVAALEQQGWRNPVDFMRGR